MTGECPGVFLVEAVAGALALAARRALALVVNEVVLRVALVRVETLVVGGTAGVVADDTLSIGRR